MLILTERNPDISLYYLGSRIIEFFYENNQQFYITELYSLISKTINIPFHRFILTLDWLFMLGVINENESGKISLCISET
ncbi:ABC-three component system middle component 6 [Acinetobacter pittii]|uniref:ABC-three component system middle component 6 n=1 Tax=Acinetobacter pittii TaxID=48296 RepID=UPI0005C5B9D9